MAVLTDGVPNKCKMLGLREAGWSSNGQSPCLSSTIHQVIRRRIAFTTSRQRSLNPTCIPNPPIQPHAGRAATHRFTGANHLAQATSGPNLKRHLSQSSCKPPAAGRLLRLLGWSNMDCRDGEQPEWLSRLAAIYRTHGLP